MTEDGSSYRRPLGYAGMVFGIATLIGLFTLGPIDLTRTAYNSVVGDVPLIRSRAVEYCRKNIQKENPSFNALEVEQKLAYDLDYSLNDGNMVDPQGVRMMELWDAIEDHASNSNDRWIWPSL